MSSASSSRTSERGSCCFSAMRRSKATGSVTLHPRREAEVWKPPPPPQPLPRRALTPGPSWKLYENPSFDSSNDGLPQPEDDGLCSEIGDPEGLALKTPPRDVQSLPRTPTRELVPKKRLSLSAPTSEASLRASSTKRISSRQTIALQAHISRVLEKHKSPSAVNSDQLERVDSSDETDKVLETTSVSLTRGPATSNRDSNVLLERLRTLEEQNASNIRMINSLKAELDLAHSRVRELEAANKSSRKEIENLLKKIADDKAAFYVKEQERIKQALHSVKDEAEEERKSKKKTELAHRKLSRELGEAKVALSKAMEELEKERKGKELMEEVCDELAREIGQDKAEIEDFKRDAMRLRQEVEEERKMLQVAEVWREERVHMKLSEASYAVHEKVAILDELRNQLEQFLVKCKKNGEIFSSEVKEALLLNAAVDQQTAAGIHLKEVKEVSSNRRAC